MLYDEREVIKVKLCVVFPGIGYGTDRPLLYYPKKYLRNDYQTVDIKYTGDPKKAKSKKENLRKFYENAYQLVEKQLSDINFDDYDDILFISKSVGTALSARYAKEHHLKVRSVLFTPLDFTFENACSPAIAFSGTKDPWINLETIKKLAHDHQVPLTVIKNANHSLETGDILKDIDHLHDIMEKVITFINEKEL